MPSTLTDFVASNRAQAGQWKYSTPWIATIERRDTACCKQNVRFIVVAHTHLYRSKDSVF